MYLFRYFSLNPKQCSAESWIPLGCDSVDCCPSVCFINFYVDFFSQIFGFLSGLIQLSELPKLFLVLKISVMLQRLSVRLYWPEVPFKSCGGTGQTGMA